VSKLYGVLPTNTESVTCEHPVEG